MGKKTPLLALLGNKKGGILFGYKETFTLSHASHCDSRTGACKYIAAISKLFDSHPVAIYRIKRKEDYLLIYNF